MPDSNLIIEKETPVYISVNGFNRDSKYFENPHEFLPDRILTEATQELPSTSLAFGIGSRSCIGG